MRKCDFCRREVETEHVRITDEYGVRFRYFCKDCIERFSQNVQIDVIGTEADETDPKAAKAEAAASRGKYKNETGSEPFFMTTTNSFEGYRIVEYKGIVFDEAIYGKGFKTSVKEFGDMFASLTGEEMYAVSDRMGELKMEVNYSVIESPSMV